MSIQSYNTINSALEQFASNHLTLKRYQLSFFEQMDNFSTSGNSFPILYVVPSDVTFDENIDSYSIRVYCVDILQKDRSNEKTILNETLLVLRDLTNWLRQDETNDLNTLNTPRAIPVNNFLMDFTVGWYCDIVIEASTETTDCSIPFSDNFIFTGHSCSINTVSPYLTCETLLECQNFINLENRVIALEALTDTTVTGGTFNQITGDATFTNNTGGTFTVTGFTTADSFSADTYWISGSTGTFSIKAKNDSGLDATGNYAVAEGYGTIASGFGSHAEGGADDTFINLPGGYAYGKGSHAEGVQTTAIGDYTHAEGYLTTAVSIGSHAEGSNTKAFGGYSHAEGDSTTASSDVSHAEGGSTKAIGVYSHVEGLQSTTTSTASHAEGYLTTSSGIASHSEGQSTTATGSTAHAEGKSTKAFGLASHSEGSGTTAIDIASHAEGLKTTAQAPSSHAEGSGTTASGINSHAEGELTHAEGINSHAEGTLTFANNWSHAEGYETTAIGDTSHAEGYLSIATGTTTHAEGWGTTAMNQSTHSEGEFTTAQANYSHAEGHLTKTFGTASHAEGYGTTANGGDSHAEGNQSTAGGDYSHAEGGSTTTIGQGSHSQNSQTKAHGDFSHAGGSNSIASGITSFIHSTNSRVNGARSVVLGGTNITGNTDDTVYTPYLNIQSATTGTSNAILVRESNGDVKYRNTNTLLSGNTGDLISFSNTNVQSNIPDVAIGSVLISQGVGVKPIYSAGPQITKLTAYPGITTTIGSSPGVVIGDNGGHGGTGNLYQLGLHFSTSQIPSTVVGSIVTDGAGSTKTAFFVATRNVTTNTAPLERLRVDTNGNTGIGVTVPTAVLHLKAGGTAASSAPFKYTSGGSLNTVAEVGAKEFVSDKEYLTITGGTRKEIGIIDPSTGLTSGYTVVSTTNGRLTNSNVLASALTRLSQYNPPTSVSPYVVGLGTASLAATADGFGYKIQLPNTDTPSIVSNIELWDNVSLQDYDGCNMELTLHYTIQSGATIGSTSVVIGTRYKILDIGDNFEIPPVNSLSTTIPLTGKTASLLYSQVLGTLTGTTGGDVLKLDTYRDSTNVADDFTGTINYIGMTLKRI